eukprot:gene12981-15343_t
MDISWKISCLMRQLHNSKDLITEARLLGRDYCERLLKRTILAAEEDSQEVAFLKAFIRAARDRDRRSQFLNARRIGYELESSSGASQGASTSCEDEETEWCYKTFAYTAAEDALDSRDLQDDSLPTPERASLVTLRVSPNLFAGGTGCHDWDAGFYLVGPQNPPCLLATNHPLSHLGYQSVFRDGKWWSLDAALGWRQSACDPETIANLQYNLEINGVK